MRSTVGIRARPLLPHHPLPLLQPLARVGRRQVRHAPLVLLAHPLGPRLLQRIEEPLRACSALAHVEVRGLEVLLRPEVKLEPVEFEEREHSCFPRRVSRAFPASTPATPP